MHRLTNELARAVTGGRIDKITQPNKQTVQLSIRQPGENFILFISINPQNPTMYLIDKPLENPPEPPAFCMALRKQLETGRIAKVAQSSLDRVMRLDIDTVGARGRIVTKSLVMEFMGKYSNIILVNAEDGIIMDCLRRVGTTSSRVRLVLPNMKYELPPNKEKINALETTPEDIARKIKSYAEHEETKTMKLSAVLSDVCMGFGPITNKEIAHIAHLSPSATLDTLDAVDFATLAVGIESVVNAMKDESTQPMLVIDRTKKIRAISAFPIHYLDANETKSLTFESMSAMLAAATELTGSYVPPEKETFRHLVRNELSRATNKKKKLLKEQDAAENAENCRIIADNLMTYQYQLEDHVDKEITVTNIYSSAGEQIKIPLDVSITISQNIQKYYRKYNKLKRAQIELKEQIATCDENIRYLESIAASLDSSETLAEIADIKRELVAAGYLRDAKKATKKPGEKPSEPLSLKAPDGSTILVGKNNTQNDRLTFKIAKKGDLWLHTKDIPGSHVILKKNKDAGEEFSPETIAYAASIAAKFSTASTSSKVPVDYVPVEQIRKPNGSKPGFVIFTGQKTIYVAPNDDIL